MEKNASVGVIKKRGRKSLDPNDRKEKIITYFPKSQIDALGGEEKMRVLFYNAAEAKLKEINEK